jgi:hypothetical protein
MKSKYAVVFSLCSFILLSVACNKEKFDNLFLENKGFIEYQYRYTLDGVAKTAYQRCLLQDAKWEINTTKLMAGDSLREINLYLYSKGAVWGSAKQDSGSAVIRAILVDNKLSSDTLFPYDYIITPLTGFVRSPVCLQLDGGANWLKDTGTGQPGYNFVLTGQATKYVRVISVGKGIYQVTAQGAANGLIYNLIYTGKINK